MNSIPSIALSGMAAATTQMSVAAHNVANANTPGFHRQSVALQSQPGGGVTSSVQTQASPSTPFDLNANLTTDLVQQMAASYAFMANLRTIQTHDKMLGRLFDSSV